MNRATSILLASYGVSLFWRPTLAAIDLRIANPELHVTQEKPFVLALPEPLHIDPQNFIRHPEQALGHPNGVEDPMSPPQEVIQQEVIVFSSVKHSAGTIVTGWKYPNGSGHVPNGQFCYYLSPNADQSSTKIDIAAEGVSLGEKVLTLVPESQEALKKCRWWHACSLADRSCTGRPPER